MNNCFSISRTGAREKVKAALKDEFAKPKESPQHQIEAVKTYIASQIDALPKEFNAVSVAANGEISDGRSILHTVVVNGQKLDI